MIKCKNLKSKSKCEGTRRGSALRHISLVLVSGFPFRRCPRWHLSYPHQLQMTEIVGLVSMGLIYNDLISRINYNNGPVDLDTYVAWTLDSTPAISPQARYQTSRHRKDLIRVVSSLASFSVETDNDWVTEHKDLVFVARGVDIDWLGNYCTVGRSRIMPATDGQRPCVLNKLSCYGVMLVAGVLSVPCFARGVIHNNTSTERLND